MPRRGKTGVAEDIMQTVVRLPWWVGVVLAVVFYLVLHRVASQPAGPLPTQPGQIGAAIVRTFGTTLAGIGQYLLPLLCPIGAGMSAWRRRERRGLAAGVAHNDAADALDGIGWRDVERLVGAGFRMQGY